MEWVEYVRGVMEWGGVCVECDRVGRVHEGCDRVVRVWQDGWSK